MPRIPIYPRREKTVIRMTESEKERLRKSAEALKMTQTDVLLRGLAWAEAEIAKGQVAITK